MDIIKMFLIGNERKKAEKFINIMNVEGYEVSYLNEELDVMSGKLRKTIHFTQSKKEKSK